jgi:hypothetical protein
MLDLDTIDASVLLFRGQYATVRGAHEDEKKRLSILCGRLQSDATMVLRRMQPDNDDVPESVDELIASARKTLDDMQSCVTQIESLAKQRAELKPLAWR